MSLLTILNGFMLPLLYILILYLLQAYIPKFQSFVFKKGNRVWVLFLFSFVVLYSALFLAKKTFTLSFLPFYCLILLFLSAFIWGVQLHYLKQVVFKVYRKLLIGIIFMLNIGLYFFFVISFFLCHFISFTS